VQLCTSGSIDCRFPRKRHGQAPRTHTQGGPTTTQGASVLTKLCVCCVSGNVLQTSTRNSKKATLVVPIPLGFLYISPYSLFHAGRKSTNAEHHLFAQAVQYTDHPTIPVRLACLCVQNESQAGQTSFKGAAVKSIRWCSISDPHHGKCRKPLWTASTKCKRHRTAK